LWIFPVRYVSLPERTTQWLGQNFCALLVGSIRPAPFEEREGSEEGEEFASQRKARVLPSGKHTKTYGKIHHFSWENPLFLWPWLQ